MSELKAYCPHANRDGFYHKSDVDALLAEKDEEIAELKQKLEDVQASMYADVVDTNMENRRLRRAVYKACANWARTKIEYERLDSDMFTFGITTEKEVSWESMMKKCLKKVEEFR